MTQTEFEKGDFVVFRKPDFPASGKYFGYFSHTFEGGDGQKKWVMFDPSRTSRGNSEKIADGPIKRWQTGAPEFLQKETPPADYPPVPTSLKVLLSLHIHKEQHIAGLSPEHVNWDAVMKGGWTE